MWSRAPKYVQKTLLRDNGMIRIYGYFWFTDAEGGLYLPDPFLKKGVSVFLNVLGRNFFFFIKKGSASGTVTATYFSYIAQSLWKQTSIFVNWEPLQQFEVLAQNQTVANISEESNPTGVC